MKRINKYLNSINVDLEHYKNEVREHPLGRSFYNDGTYEVEVYRVIGGSYLIENKVTGRKEFTLYKHRELIGIGFSQSDFIEKVLKSNIEKRVCMTD